MESRILLTGAEMDLFTFLTPAPLSVREIAEKKKADSRGLTILLDAPCRHEFAGKGGGKIPMSPPRSPDFFPGTLRNRCCPWFFTWPICGDDGLISRRSFEVWMSRTEPISSSPAKDEDELRAFIGAMNVVAKPLAPRVVSAIGPGSSRALLDVGGAMGTYTLAFLEAAPGMRATIFDRPDVIELARKHLGDAGMLGRVRLASGDFYADELPGGHDLALLSAIIHQNGPDQNVALFSRVFRALIPGGRIVIRDHVMTPDRTRPKDGAVFAVNMLLVTPAGGTYTYDQIREALLKAGFERINLLQEGDHMDGLVEAFKP